MLWAIVILMIPGIVTLPGLWVRHVMQKYTEPAYRYRSGGTGGEFARHMLDRFDM